MPFAILGRALLKRAQAALTLAAALWMPAAMAQTVTYFHNDASGTPLVATDASGNVVWKENYRPYGDRLNNQPASSRNKIGFAGRPYDGNTGLSYMGARYYDPVIGRFSGIDAALPEPENVHSLNRYAYANNNPYRYVDPDGNTPLDVAFLVWDIGKLTYIVATGRDGAGAAAVDVGLSLLGVVSPIPGTGQAIKAARATERGISTLKAADHVAGAGKAAKDGKTLYHYTDAAGAKGIAESGVIRADAKGKVFVTDQKLSPSEVKDRLFIGRSGQKGSHVVEIKPAQGMAVRPGKNANELIHQGSIRDGRQGNLTVRSNE